MSACSSGLPASEASSRCSSARLCQVAGLVIVAEDELAVLGQPVRLRIFVHAIDRGDGPVLKFARDRFVRREHELFDQLMRLIVFDPFEEDRPAFRVQSHFHFWKIEVERSVFETLSCAGGRQAPRPRWSRSLNWSLGGALKNGVGLAIGQAARAADDRSGETAALRAAILRELNEDRMGQAVHRWIETANAVAQSLRQHRNDAIGQINAVAALVRFAVQRRARFHVGGNVGDVDTETPAAAGDSFDIDRVIEVAGIVGIDRDNELVAQIFASLEHFRSDRLWDFSRFVEHVLLEIRSEDCTSE